MESKSAAPSFPAELTADQKSVLQKFSEYAKSKQSGVAADESTLTRFLRAKKFDLPAATEMWEGYLKWRKENDVEGIEKAISSDLEVLKQVYPHGFYNTDKAGRPVYIERLGMLDLTKIFQISSEDRLTKYYIYILELLVGKVLPICSKQAGRPIDQCIVILDLKGASTTMLSKRIYNLIQKICSVCQDYYPELLAKLYIVNSPMLFSNIWTVIKTYIDENTKKKIETIGSKFEAQLAEIIEPANLPDFLGGKSTEEIAFYPGPWQSVLSGGESPMKGGQKQDDEEEQSPEDLENLKNMLSGMNLGGQMVAPNTDKTAQMKEEMKEKENIILATSAKFNPLDHGVTPLNTQMEEDKEDYNSGDEK